MRTHHTVLSAIALGLLSSSLACSASHDAGTETSGSDLSENDPATSSRVTGVSFPQAIAGAMWASPATYASIPLHIAVKGTATSVIISVDHAAPITATHSQDGTWVAKLPITSLSEGNHYVVTTATGGGGSSVRAQALLGIGSDGMEMTSVNVEGNAGTARILPIGGKTYLSWTDRSGAHADAYLQEIDGAGNWLGTKTSIVGSTNDVFGARTAVGTDGAVGVLYQEGTGSNPYVNFIEIVDTKGKKLVAPIALDPKSMYGSYGGDIAFDGKAFVATWRSNSGAGESQLMWIRVAANGTVTGPVAVSPLAAGSAEGGFDPITPIHIAAANGKSVLSYVQYHQDTNLDSEVPKARATVMNADGSIAKTSYCGKANDSRWYAENRSFALGTTAGAFCSSYEVSDNTSPPTVFSVAKMGTAETLATATTFLTHSGDRAEPFVISHPSMNAVVAWTDLRSEVADPSAGHIQLMAAPMNATMKEGTAVLFDHARFIESTSDLNTALAGTNVVMVWLDERHGGGIFDPKPEVFMETVWY